MAEALVSSVLHQLSLTIWKAEQRVKLVTCVKEEVEKLKRNFEAIQDVLEDAEEKRIVEKNVSRWLDKLKDVSFDMEDVLDEWNTALFKLQSKTDEVERSSFAKRMLQGYLNFDEIDRRKEDFDEDSEMEVKGEGGKSVHGWEEETKRAKLHNKIHLTELEMSLKMGGRWAEQEVKNKVIQALNPPPNLHVEWS
ncbi:cc-nbs-lrr resistance protein [Corchorus olitorius]|uniref:Cc-nbs-lrr resistance protein n=1 Tax=Corchorus olitorius TaxID=93759 RepID=A0A1R3HFF5_9ROSI|nr:cc-nbs-lrr resistance protein [Corchorus olitorius]